jgi:hypothetical protein
MKKSWLVLALVVIFTLAACGRATTTPIFSPAVNLTSSPTAQINSAAPVVITSSPVPTNATPDNSATPAPLAGSSVDPLDSQLSNLNQIINDTSDSLSGAPAGPAGGE